MSFALTREELHSPAHAKWLEMLAARLQQHREMNDSTTFSETDTAKLRGRIAEVKALLALASESAQATSDTGSDALPESWGQQ